MGQEGAKVEVSTLIEKLRMRVTT